MIQQIIAITGSICSGKDSLKDYLIKKHKYKAVKLGNILRGEAKERGIKVNRDNLYELSKKLNKYDPCFLVKKAVAEAEKREWEKILIVDIRKEAEIKCLRRRFKRQLKFIQIDASQQVRFKRIKARRRRGDPKTLADFKKLDAKEFKRFGLKKLFQYADFVIINNDGYESLYTETDLIMKRINK